MDMKDSKDSGDVELSLCQLVEEKQTDDGSTLLTEMDDCSLWQNSVTELYEDCDDGTSRGSRFQSLTWSLASNTMFLSGSILYVALAVLELEGLDMECGNDIVELGISTGSNDTIAFGIRAFAKDTLLGGGTNNDEEEASQWLCTWSSYRTLDSVAAAFYVLNALIDFYNLVLMSNSCCGNGYRMDFAAVITFYVAAMLDLVGALFGNDTYPIVEYVFAKAAVHVYLLNAVLNLQSRGNSLLFGLSQNKSNRIALLLRLGDLLFLGGSLIDVGISWFASPDESEAQIDVTTELDILSAVLWLLDALLYVASDLHLLEYQVLSHPPPSTPVSPDCKDGA